MFNRLVGVNIFNNEAGRMRPNDAVTTTWFRGAGFKLENWGGGCNMQSARKHREKGRSLPSRS